MRPIAIAFSGPRTVAFLEEKDRPLEPGEVRLRTLYSGISAGTELATFRGTNPHMRKRWDGDLCLFVDDPAHESVQSPASGYPVTAGYEEVGEVVEAGAEVEGVPLGSVVYGIWGHRTMYVTGADYARERLLPTHVDPLFGIFSHIGATALNGILDSAIRLGETVAVFGLGVVGQLVAQLARLSGAEVIGVDLLSLRLDVARQVGIDHVVDARDGPAAEVIKDLTGGRGADVCIEASGSARALHEAVRSCAYAAKVVALGFYQGEAQGLHLGEEFHHNRISIVCSQIGGVASELQHRWDRLRLARTFMRFIAQGKLQLRPLITHVVPATEAPGLFRLLDEQPSEVLQAVLDFRLAFPPSLPDEKAAADRVERREGQGR